MQQRTRFGVLGIEGLIGVVGWRREARRWRGRRWHEQAVTGGIHRVVEELRRMEKLLRVPAWLEVDVWWPASRELIEEYDGGGSAWVGRRSQQFDIKA
jgi:hypothetical protein